MRLHLYLAAMALLASGEGPRTTSKTVTVAVVESGSRRPIKEFSYRYAYRSTGQSKGFGERWTAVESAEGTCVVDVPASCKLSLEIKGRDHVGGRAMDKEVIIRSNDDPGRVVEVELTRGATVRGIVRDLETKAPIAGATVTAMVPGGMLIMKEVDWAVTTDARGRYELRGVDPTFSPYVAHPAYSREERGPDGKELGHEFSEVRDVYLKRRTDPPLRGIVRLAGGVPLEGVTVIDGDRFQGRPVATSDKDGSFAVLDHETSSLRFTKRGFVARELSTWKGELKPRERIALIMEPQTPLRGHVVAHDGSPVRAFTICAGTGPVTGRTDHVEAQVADVSGRFSLDLDHAGKNWVGVRAEGFAAWDGFIEVASDGEPREIRLDAGVRLSAKLVAPMRGGGVIHAELIPRRDKTKREHGLSGDLIEEEFSTMRADVPADGALIFPHVRPDRYLLILNGPTITPRRFAIDVPGRDLELGEVMLAGRGRIVGRVFRPAREGGGPWEFVWGQVSAVSQGPIPGSGFTSDEDGRFLIEDVPEGNADVRFLTQMGCVIDGPSWNALVMSGRTTQDHAFEPGKERPLTVQLIVGDGSMAQHASGGGLTTEQLRRLNDPDNPRFAIGLTPLRHAPAAFHDMDFESPDDKGRLTLRDVDPGDYRLRVFESRGAAGVLSDQVVTVPPPQPIRIPLGAGSMTGKWTGSEMFGPKATVIATPHDRSKPVRTATTNSEGFFQLKFLDPGTYTVTAHDPRKGWSRLEGVTVSPGVTRVGPIEPRSRGGAISATIRFARPSAVPDEILATDGSGNAIRQEFEVYSSFDALSIPGLWPGRWTVRAMAGAEVLATARTVLVGAESSPVELVVGADEGP